MTTQDGLDDQRFAELLRPIKDLTANFDVPLSQFLDTYYTELKAGIGLATLDSQEMYKVNFAEAGLFLQGTATVYSKKVEFLWQTVLKMLDFLSSQKSLESLAQGKEDGTNPEGEESKDEGKRRRKCKNVFDVDFSALECDFSSHTLMKDVHDFVEKFNFIAVTPCQLIEKEGKELKDVHSRVNIHAWNGTDLLGPKDDFRVNAQFCTETAVLGDGIVSTFHDLSVSLCETNEDYNQVPQAFSVLDNGELQNHDELPPLLQEEDVEDVENREETVAAEPEAKDSVENNDIDSAKNNVVDLAETDINLVETETNNNEIRKSKRQLAQRLEAEKLKEKPSLTNAWEPVKPHEAVTAAKNAVKTRRTTLLSQRSASTKRKTKVKKPSGGLTNVNLSEYFGKERNSTHPSKKEAVANMAPELNKEAYEEEQRRKNVMKKNVKDENLVNEVDDDDVYIDPEEQDDRAVSDDVQNEDVIAEDWDPPDPHADVPIPEDNSSQQESIENAVDSYEELVVKRVAAFVAQSQDYIESTDLAKKVAAWHEEIRPRLEAVESRGSFDIHSYGTKVINSFPDDDRKTTISFRSVVKDVEKEEVSRYFLSCLMLANTQNIDLESESMNEVNLTLLSKKRHHEELMHSQGSPLTHKRSSISKSTNIDQDYHRQVLDDLDKFPDPRVAGINGLADSKIFVVPNSQSIISRSKMKDRGKKRRR